MAEVNCVEEVSAWLSNQLSEWTSRGITARLKTPTRADLNKAEVTFESATHVASVTAWGTGTVDLIVMDLTTRVPEEGGSGWEFQSVQELRTILEGCGEAVMKLINSTPDGTC